MEPTDATQTADPFARGNTAFALALYGNLAAKERGNVFLSPCSISSALAMTFGGARGLTEREMAATLRFPERGERLHASFSRLTGGLNELGRAGQVQLRVANALWGHDRFRFLPDFIQLARRRYGAGLTPLDFGDAEGARRTINAWVEGETRGKITDLIPDGALSGLTHLVLTNAVYFKGDWASPFEKKATQDAPFRLLGGGSVPSPLMRQTAELGYFETSELQGLELPYAGGELAMTVLLPRSGDGLAALEGGLDETRLSSCLGLLERREVEVLLPRFKVTARFRLDDALIALGMPSAFKLSEVPKADEADFSGMTGERDLHLSAVLHKAFVDVNEEGTEAAAATAVLMCLGESVAPSVPLFRADHPFLFLIRDRRDGTILFVGRLADPQEA